VTEDGQKLATARITNSVARLAAEIRRAGPQPKVVLGACCGWYWAADALAAACAEVHLAHPLGVKAFSHHRVKNDELDARDLADLLRMGKLAEVRRFGRAADPKEFLVRDSTGHRPASCKATSLTSGNDGTLAAPMRRSCGGRSAPATTWPASSKIEPDLGGRQLGPVLFSFSESLRDQSLAAGTRGKGHGSRKPIILLAASRETRLTG
jgi:hypothetical protein